MADAIANPRDAGAVPCWTRREIAQQPTTLRRTQAVLTAQRATIDAFLTPVLATPDLRIILAGAGTSAFIGECLALHLSTLLGRHVEAIATTDIVSAPALYLSPRRPTLLVSFGRSGNSPESIAALDLADQLIDWTRHLVITCNDEGALARRHGDRHHGVILPPETHDRAFAMTSSFTAMMLSALSIFSGIGAMGERIEAIATSVDAMLTRSAAPMAALAERGFHRVVYLGSGTLAGLAREAVLKLLELTDGAVVATSESSLGFRHGPKTFIDAQTLVIAFVSNDPHARAYDLDMIAELRRDARCGAVLAIGTGELEADALIVPAMVQANDVDLLFPLIVPAQLLAVECSTRLGIDPDQPSRSGTVNRVVEGVTIHPYRA